MTYRYGILTARCGRPRRFTRLIKAAALEVKRHQSQYYISMAYRKINGPYLDNGQVCVDYEYGPARSE